MRCIYIVILSLAFSFSSTSQVVEYFNINWQPSIKANATFYREITYDKKGNPSGIVRDFFMSGELQWEGYLSSVNPPVNDGENTWYYRNGQPFIKAVFKNGVPTLKNSVWTPEGERISYRFSAQVRDSFLRALNLELGTNYSTDLTSANDLSSRVFTLVNNQDFNKALQVVQLCGDLYLLNGDGFSWLGAQNSLGFRYCELGKYEEALAVFKQTLKISELLFFPFYEAMALRGIGITYCHWRPDFRLAREALKKSRKILEAANNSLELFYADYNLAKTYVLLGYYHHAEAVEEITEAISHAKMLNMGSYEADLWNDLGAVHHQQMHYDSAYLAYSHAVERLQSLNQEAWTVQPIIGKASTLVSQNKFEEANSLLAQAMAIADKYNNLNEKAKCLTTLGLWLFNKGDYRGGIKNLEQARDLYQQINNILEYANTLESLGWIYKNQQAYDRAIEIFYQAMKIFEANGYLKKLADGYLNIGHCYFSKEEYGACIEKYNQAIALFDSLKLGVEKGIALNQLGFVELLQGQTAKSEISFAKSTALHVEHSRTDLIVNQKIGKANIFRIRGEFDNAVKEYQSLLKEAKNQEDHLKLAYFYHSLGDLFAYTPQYFEDARKQYLLAIEEYLITENYIAAAFSRSNLGRVLFSMGKYEDALIELKNSSVVFEQSNFEIQLGSIYSSIGMVYNYKNENDKALEYLEKAKFIFEKTDNDYNPYFSQVLRTMGDIYSGGSNADKADAVLQKLLNIQTQQKQSLQLATTLKDIGMINAYQGNDLEGVPSLLKARGLFEKEKQFDEMAQIDLALTFCYIINNEYEKASKSIEFSTTNFNNLVDEETKIGVLVYSALFSYGTEEVQNSIKSMEKARQIALQNHNKEWESIINLFLSLFYSMNGDLEKAKILLDILTKEASSAQTLGLNIQAMMGYDAFIYYNEGNYQKAYEKLEKSIQYKETMLASQKGEKMLEIISNMFFTVQELSMLCLKELKRDVEAFSVAENSKARILNKLIQERKVKDLPLPAALQQSKNKLQEELNQIDLTLQKEGVLSGIYEQLTLKKKAVLAEFNALTSDIREQAPAYIRLVYPEPINYELIRPTLQDDELIVSYYLARSEAFVFLATKDTLIMATLVNPDQVKVAIRYFKDQYVQESIPAIKRNDLVALEKLKKTFFTSSSQLYKILIKPFEKYIHNKKLIIIPHQELYYLPFELLIKDSIVKPYHEYNYLVKSYNIAYYPSASALYYERTRKQESAPPSRDMLAIGDPIFGKEDKRDFFLDSLGFFTLRDAKYSSDLPRLKYAGQELNNIAAVYENGEVFTGTKATEDLIKSLNNSKELSKYRYLHFSTHGLINERFPDLSCIALNQDENKTEDGLLHTYEIFQLNLNADLVVLSACGTGLGRLHSAEGMVGFSRSLMYAGTPSLILSLWSVDDQSTAQLFSTYYQSLKALNGKDKQASLRIAQLKLIESGNEYANPFYWAPFIFIGEAESKF